MSAPGANRRVVAGMRPAGPLHLGEYLGTLRTWVRLQQEHECFFFVADWHALANSYLDTSAFRRRTHDIVVDWLAAGVDPQLATLFVQSRVPECAELYVLLSMCTPLSWLERVAAARVEAAQGGAAASSGSAASPGAGHAPGSAASPGAAAQQAAPAPVPGAPDAGPGVPIHTPGHEQQSAGEPATFGQLGYPLLQGCDILVYRPTHACVVEEQALHVELTRDVARRFNHLFGREEDGERRVERAVRRLGRSADTYLACRRAFQEQGDETALTAGTRLVNEAPKLTVGDRERLIAHLEGGGRALLAEPEMLLVSALNLPGTDGRPMSAARGNTIGLRDEPDAVNEKLRRMPTDPARVRRTDPGEPENCPVWRYHVLLGDEDSRRWVSEGCRGARIGCTECKQHAADRVNTVLAPVGEAAREYDENPEVVRSIVMEGTERARDVARDTMNEVRRAMCLAPR